MGVAFGAVTEHVLGRNIWIEYCRRRGDSQFVEYDMNGITLYLDPEDKGISRKLLIRGKWETELAEQFRQQVERVRTNSDATVNALEIGANKGYYSFQMADALEDAGHVYACEPAPTNFRALRRGVEANGFDNIDICNVAIGTADGKSKMHVSSHSNRHTLVDDIPHTHNHLYKSEMEVNVLSVETYLERFDLEAHDVDIVRMDVEGYETDIFEGLSDIFYEGSPKLLFMELHPHRTETDALQEIVDVIEDARMEITAHSGEKPGLASFATLRNYINCTKPSHSIEIITTANSD